MAPFSTAAFDPKWYHSFGGPHYTYRDLHHVINGLRAEELVVGEEVVDALEIAGKMCTKDCRFKDNLPCAFMQKYKEWLDKNVNFDELVKKMETAASRANMTDDETVIVLMVHEPASCKCAERPVLQQYFREHGIELPEWTPSHQNKEKIMLF